MTARILWSILCGLKRGAQHAYGIRGRHLTNCPNGTPADVTAMVNWLNGDTP